MFIDYCLDNLKYNINFKKVICFKITFLMKNNS